MINPKLILIVAGLIGITYGIFCILFIDKYPASYVMSGILILTGLYCILGGG